jgi:hypothetical protein
MKKTWEDKYKDLSHLVYDYSISVIKAGIEGPQRKQADESFMKMIDREALDEGV